MFHCPFCKTSAHSCTSRYMSDNVEQRYHQCRTSNARPRSTRLNPSTGFSFTGDRASHLCTRTGSHR
ncbi:MULTISPECIES: ogr/Delta-like zinc finger family protein [Klebsiella]|uniref:ogr/Delta-like zinc finger family protein n=1 Tax=Klebsiella TaxID=570 RepID=UPI003753B065